MSRVLACLAALALLGSVPRAEAQVVQLPTFSSFSVGTTVVVPDRGSLYLGGVKRAREGSVSRGAFFPNRGIGREVGRSDAAISATIIDLNELDQEVLAAARRMRAEQEARKSPATRAAEARQQDVKRKAIWITRHLGRGGLGV